MTSPFFFFSTLNRLHKFAPKGVGHDASAHRAPPIARRERQPSAGRPPLLLARLFRPGGRLAYTRLSAKDS
jgi:hypothetical protein